MKTVYEDSEIGGSRISRLIEILSEIKANFGDIQVRVPFGNKFHQEPICKIEVKAMKSYSATNVISQNDVFLHGISESDVLRDLEKAYEMNTIRRKL